MTKYQKQLVKNYHLSPYTDTIFSAYEKPSRAKIRALYNCYAFQKEFDGYDGRICTKNTFMFTYAFRYIDKDPETGVVSEYLAYITPSKIEFIEL